MKRTGLFGFLRLERVWQILSWARKRESAPIIFRMANLHMRILETLQIPRRKRESVRKELFAATNENPFLNGKQLKQHMSAFQDQSTQVNLELHVALHFHHINREGCVRVFTGLPSPVIFEKIFSWIEVKAKHIQYWKGEKVTLTPVAYTHNVNSKSRYGPPRSLTLEQEFLLVLMRLRMGLLVVDLAFRFKITCSQVSCIFTAWIKLLLRELGVLIVWPSKTQVKKTMPYCFRKMYPNCRVIMDCTEVYTETPTALDIAAALWSDYKQHHTFKFLVAITQEVLYLGCLLCTEDVHLMFILFETVAF